MYVQLEYYKKCKIQKFLYITYCTWNIYGIKKFEISAFEVKFLDSLTIHSLLICFFHNLLLSISENHHFPAKPLRESQSHLLTDPHSWTETNASIEKNKLGMKGFLYTEIYVSAAL